MQSSVLNSIIIFQLQVCQDDKIFEIEYQLFVMRLLWL